MGVAARLAGLAGLTGGLVLAPFAGGSGAELVALGAAGVAGALLLSSHGPGGPAVVLLAASLCCAGLALGNARLAAIDDGALVSSPGSTVTVRGYVTAAPARSGGELLVPLSTPAGRLVVQPAGPVSGIEVGKEVSASGRTSRGPPWVRDRLRAGGVRTVLESRSLAPTGHRRAGLWGLIDSLRRRSERALGLGMPPREAALARGFVLGQDEEIDARTVEDFRRSGLAHLLAVSGQNVALLAVLATPFLVLLGLSLRARLLCTAVLILVYVPLAGGGPSIQRAGVMGVAALVALAAGRPASRLYGLLLAAAATLALDPRASADVGWQLSFAAVAGILALGNPLSRGIAARLGPGPAQRAVAEGVAMSASATLATAPLVAHHFDTVSLAALPANLVALPAVAPAMWLGMLAAAAGQLPGLPVGLLNDLNGVLLAYIAQVAAWFGDPAWATVGVGLGSPGAVAAVYAALALAWLAARRLRPRMPSARRLLPVALAAAALVTATGPALLPAADLPPAPQPGTLRVTVLDVGQGDAILIEPPARSPVLVDAGPAEADVGSRLRAAGIEDLAAVVLTHDQSDHAGGLPSLAELHPARFVFARASAGVRASMAEAGAAPIRIAAGQGLRVGSLRLEVLWPPRELALAPGAAEDPNSRSLVILARWRRFEMLLTGDAEAELAPVEPGPVDVLKVAHHGSADPGLAALLGRTTPALAVISVGANSYGHPAPETLAELDAAGVSVLRTDHAGDVVLEISGNRLRITEN